MYFEPDSLNAGSTDAGFEEITNTDYGRLLKATMERLNEDGGIAGCQIEPIYFPFYYTVNWAQQAEEACALFTEDHDVFGAIVVANLAGRGLVDCLRERGVIQYWTDFGNFALTVDDYAELGGYVFQPSDIAIDRRAFVIDMLAEAGYFTPDAVLGVAGFDDSGGAVQYMIDEVYGPALAELGIDIAETAILPTVSSVEASGDVQAAATNAVLRFKDAGVTHVLMINGATAAVLPALGGSQGFLPRYALTSNDNIYLASSSATPDVFVDALAVSWNARADSTGDPNIVPPNPAREECEMRFGPADDPELVDFQICDALNFFNAGFGHATEFSIEGFRDGVERLGTEFVSVQSFGPTEFGPGHFDGGVEAWLMEYDPTIAKFVYVGEPRQVP